MPIYHGCIFTQYTAIQDVISVWEKKCDRICVAEHPADGATKRIHCHILIESSQDVERFRESGKEVMKEFFKRGNYWFATKVQKGEHAGKPIDFDLGLVYILKGKFAPKYSKNISDELLENSRQGWVDSAKDDTPEKSPLDHWIQVVLSRFDKWPTYLAYEVDFDIKYEHRNPMPSPLNLLLDDIRHITYAILFERNNIAPQAQFYKQVASSAFLRLMKKWNKFDEGVHLILNLWK